MAGWDEQSVVQKEAIEEVDQKQELLVDDDAKLLVAVENLPISD